MITLDAATMAKYSYINPVKVIPVRTLNKIHFIVQTGSENAQLKSYGVKGKIFNAFLGVSIDFPTLEIIRSRNEKSRYENTFTSLVFTELQTIKGTKEVDIIDLIQSFDNSADLNRQIVRTENFQNKINQNHFIYLKITEDNGKPKMTKIENLKQNEDNFEGSIPLKQLIVENISLVYRIEKKPICMEIPFFSHSEDSFKHSDRNSFVKVHSTSTFYRIEAIKEQNKNTLFSQEISMIEHKQVGKTNRHEKLF